MKAKTKQRVSPTGLSSLIRRAKRFIYSFIGNKKESNESLKMIKADIMKISENQRMFRNQRKTINIVGERTMSHKDAQMNHFHNRITLRNLHIAYGFMRGKTIEQIEKGSKKPYDTIAVKILMDSYRVLSSVVE